MFGFFIAVYHPGTPLAEWVTRTGLQSPCLMGSKLPGNLYNQSIFRSDSHFTFSGS